MVSHRDTEIETQNGKEREGHKKKHTIHTPDHGSRVPKMTEK